MPQFDPTHFPSEIIWTLISFALLFVLLKWLVLPRLVRLIEARTRMIREEMEQAAARITPQTSAEEMERFVRWQASMSV